MTWFQLRQTLIATAAVCVLLAIGVYHAKGHGPAGWVAEGGYKNSVGELCCGERDCGFYKEGVIERVPGGYNVDAHFQVELNGMVSLLYLKGFVLDEDATPSPTGEYWACMWGGKLRCFFVPPPGFVSTKRNYGIPGVTKGGTYIFPNPIGPLQRTPRHLFWHKPWRRRVEDYDSTLTEGGYYQTWQYFNHRDLLVME